MKRSINLAFTMILLMLNGPLLQAGIIIIDGTVKSVDSEKRAITVESGAKERTLDVSNKAKIAINGKETGLDGLKSGSHVSLSYHDQLETVVKIDAFSASASTSNYLELVSVSKVWDRSPSNQFTDLCLFDNALFCVFREGSDRLSMDSSIQVLVSKDGEQWSHVTEIKLDGFDLRDPKISVTGDGGLMVSAGATKRNGHVLEKLNTVVSFSSNGKQWSKPVVVGESDMWLWNPAWKGQVMYAVGYHAREPWHTKLYRSANGKKFDIVVPNLQAKNKPSESAVAFDVNGRATCVIRRDAGTKTTLIGRSVEPYQVWNWVDTNLRISSPDMTLLPDGRILLAARLKEATDHTALFWVAADSGHLTKVLTLPGSGDQGYPGIILWGGQVWVSYHSSHEGKPAVYIARLRFVSSIEESRHE